LWVVVEGLVELVERLIPGGQWLTGAGIMVRVGVVVPDGLGVVVGVDHGGGGGPPHLEVGGCDDLADNRSGDGAADGEVGVRGEAALRFDAAEVLDVQPSARRRLCQNRSSSAGRCTASQAARR